MKNNDQAPHDCRLCRLTGRRTITPNKIVRNS